ncbi:MULTISPECIES: UTP--glucose-1-phosphate uridylyltransferase [unclassified Fibrobacter]|uniref:UTP--glucose-1-phosphate uridylyltransferase n=1 Tax=unclassified Fibrobacter TaxID=2634177 RepID=UPI000D6D156E|nr:MULTISPECIES: UTP--glucose-1-phosphate uridylyltransferase [unclassified Fibrobacter]PWJ71917.1 UDP-N-acetylglucosamine/UDP-N-acetylgalactosamine diphosphorylase [Fibrobacter sp. UWR4]PZW70367.1 UDP-N-acetylglucosamine/UDP-N-acetylgalactosamine diphosphorylase [Fibrobacter sp. UWR1]
MIEKLVAAGQGDLAYYLESLSGDARKSLERDIASQDWEELKALHAEKSTASLSDNVSSDLKPMPFKIGADDLRYEFWKETGEILLGKGQVAAFLVAGGQGSRLGFEGPKGMFDIGLPSHKSLFQLQAERLQNLAAQVGHAIPWCIMTSPLNHEATVNFFTENNFFGMDRTNIRFFEQGTICALTPDGKAVLDGEDHLALVPDGNGGCFRALAQSGTLAWLIERGVRYVFLYSVDNALCRVCDPAFIGALASEGRSMSASKVVHKANASEKVGIFAFQNKKPGVVEYSDLPEEYRDMTNPDGSLTFDGGNIAIHLFKIEGLRKLQTSKLPWHTARKTVCGIEKCWKFEQFLFDAFPQLGSMMPFGVIREEEFSPVKNAEGNDSPKTARTMIGKLHREWLRKAHVEVNENKLYEISPTLSYAGENLSRRVFERELGKSILEFDEE